MLLLNVFALPSIIMSKKRNKQSEAISPVYASMESLEERLEKMERNICRDIASQIEHIHLVSLRKTLSMKERMLRKQEEIAKLTEDIVEKMEMYGNMVGALVKKVEWIEMKLVKLLSGTWNPAVPYDNSWNWRAEPSCSTDIRCYETTSALQSPSKDMESEFNGFMESPEWVSLEELTVNIRTLMSKNLDQNGGMDMPLSEK